MNAKMKVNLTDITFDEDLYPRSQYDWKTAYDYSQSMRVGAKFPPIVLAVFEGKKILVDGKHRIEASKLLKKKEIEAIIHVGWTKKQIFLEAIKLNIAHGRGLSPYEKRRLALKLTQMEIGKQGICEIIQVPIDKIDNFVAQRLINSVTGEEINSAEHEKKMNEFGQAILKSGFKHLAGTNINEFDVLDIEEAQKGFNMSSQVELLSQVVKILERDLFDKTNPKVVKLLSTIKSLLE